MQYDPNDFTGTDSDRIQAAVDAVAAAGGGRVVIQPRRPDAAAGRSHWLLDQAILLPSGITLVIEDSRLKLSDACRDNFIRSANCGIGITDIQPLRDIHIIGEGRSVLEGADHPRASGDAANTLSTEAILEPGAPYRRISYGTDAAKPDEKPTSDWRSIGILLACVENFSLRNLRIVDAHSWAISLERCSFGTIRDLTFSANGGKWIDGVYRPIRNQDGLDLRQGCHDITIDSVAGQSGDDMVALTAIPNPDQPGGTLDSHMVSSKVPQGGGDDVYNIIIRNVRGNAGGHQLVRFLNTGGIRMHSILLDGVINTCPPERPDRATVVVGDSNPAWGGVTPLGDTCGFIITNIQGNSRHLVEIRGSLSDAIIGNLLYTEAQGQAVSKIAGPEHLRNVTISNTVQIPAPLQHTVSSGINMSS